MNLMPPCAAVFLFAACSSSVFAGVEATADGQPGGTIRIVVPYEPMGCNDLVVWASPWID